MKFVASRINGSGRGKKFDVPTVNLRMEDVPADLKEGIYAVRAEKLPAVMHYGPRPVFGDTASCEVHFLAPLDASPDSLEVETVAYLRPVQDFDSAEAMYEQIQDDIKQASAILQVP